MTEKQHNSIKRRLGFKKLLSWVFVLGGIGLTAIVLWPLFYTANVPTSVIQQQSPETTKDLAPIKPAPQQQSLQQQSVAKNTDSTQGVLPHTDTTTDTTAPEKIPQTRQSVTAKSDTTQTVQQAVQQPVQQPTSVIKNLSYEDKQQQTTITADKAIQNQNHTRLQSAEIASDADTSLLQADTAIIDNTTKQVDAQGNVYYRDKDGIEIASDRMKVKQNDSVTAIGGVTITSEGVIAKSESATYTEKDGILKMSGGVTIQIEQ